MGLLRKYRAPRPNRQGGAQRKAHGACGIEHNDVLRRVANRLVGILHECLKTRTLYDEASAWSHRQNLAA